MMMPDMPKMEELWAGNPRIDPEQIEAVGKLLRESRVSRVGRGPRQRLASPLDRRRAMVRQDPDADSRRIKLTRPPR